MLLTESVSSIFVEEEVVLLVELFTDEQSTSKSVQSTPLVSALENSKHFLLIVSLGNVTPVGSVIVFRNLDGTWAPVLRTVWFSSKNRSTLTSISTPNPELVTLQ